MSRVVLKLSIWKVFSVGVVITSAIAGCGGGDAGPKVVPVTGKVLYKGLPLTEAQVAFLGDGKSRPAVAITDTQGRFVLTTSLTGDGAVPGNHTVTVSKTVDNPSAKKVTGKISMDDAAKLSADYGKADQPATLSLIPERYSLASQSGLSFQVKEGQANDFTIDLKD